ncbi:Pre-mRNA-splicing factor CEF1 [Hanseniaspora opuntiae]|uniref:Pre-mRNA-splicing factor CEF1 n=1 Tax=Hanseniaspora opuntiae TaxID=211096 RepID=A0A1E5RSZ7_9ASCO|nr:Pre-mRNA-splicing factor CEF1 [Hanseniaspora opuntiae]
MAVSNSRSKQDAKKKINNIYKQTNIKGSSINNYWSEKEDDILTRSIQKYGINKWNKVATLLMKKSAIQCKLRWEEYLSPKINNNKQVQFNPDEDKQLIDLYEMHRDQWKTIADIMGKTASSCFNRYNELISSDPQQMDFNVNDLSGTSKDQKKKKDIKTMLSADSLVPESNDTSVTEKISHDAEQRLVANLDKKKIKKMKAERDFLEMITSNIESRRNALKIGLKNKTLKLPNQVMKFKGLTELLTDDHLKYPPKGTYDTANELEQNKKMLSKFEYLVKKKGVYLANKELGFDHIYKKRDLKKEIEKINPQVQIGKVRNFKANEREVQNKHEMPQEKVMNKILQVKPLITGRILHDEDSYVKKIEKCEDKEIVERAKLLLDGLPEPLNDFEIEDTSKDADLQPVKEEETDDVQLLSVKTEDTDL